MKSLAGILMAALFVSGCAMTAKLPQAPDASSFTRYPDVASVGVAKVQDVRGTVKAGAISAQPVEVKEDITDFCTKYLINSLNSDMKVNVTLIEETLPANDIPLLAAQKGLDRILISKLISVKFSSLDAIMDPVQTDMQMDVYVYNQSGELILKRNFFGKAEKWLGLGTSIKSTGKLVQESTLNLMGTLASDAELKSALTK
ncbi:MAG: hypothetical protein HY586_03440 [Candidatus Omnitrophica bacterium]|nr:hypothetical protein [Candidatus Omnitrophota bacterium]